MLPLRSQRHAAPTSRVARLTRTLVCACALVVPGTALLAQTAPAPSKQCRQIDSRKEREACYAQQAKQKQEAKAKAAPAAPMDNQIDLLKEENDRLTKRLQGICRGC